MRKLLIFRRATLCALCAMMFSGAAFGASRQDMKRLGVFISNFTETGLFNFDIRAENTDDDDGLLHLGMPENVTELARFGIIHNFINNKSRIKKCRDRNCESGPLVIDKKYVAESVSKYFGLELDAMDLSVIDEDSSAVFSYDGRQFHFAADSFRDPGNDAVYYAEVQDVDSEGRYTAVSGYVYDSKRTTNERGTFSAMVIPSKWQGKDSWLIISMSTEWDDDL
ncbi:MAG: hypothetical protein IJU26_01735 [Synergistaceae bacterium]|nr:hypothetical protein [Synergistaceae bacterium]